MHYGASYSSDTIATLPHDHAVAEIADHFDINTMVAVDVLATCHAAYKLGAAGLPHVKPVASRDLCELVADAWHDGIVSRKLVVNVRSGELFCECGSFIAVDEPCRECGPNAGKCQSITLSVSAPYADIWADWDQSIEGSSWETPSDMPHFAYACTIDHHGLIASLRKDGYTLDLTEYEGECDE